MKQVTAILLGAGQRGADTCGAYALQYPNELKMLAVAEPRADRRAVVCADHHIPAHLSFDSWEPLLALPKMADCVFVCTQDKMHFAPVMQALEQGYHVVCEKPMSTDAAEIRQMVAAAEKANRMLSICHTLRYSPFFSKIKELLDKGAVGSLMTIQHRESIGYWHMAHSFVRGNWRNSDETSPIILAKCCHDMDILRWLVGADCKSISSVGSLSFFTKENAPANAPAYCLDGCVHRDDCPYYAPRFYLTHPKALYDGFAKVVSLDERPQVMLETLQTSPYGRCVFQCDNNVCDHQTASMEFTNGVTADFTLSAFTEKCQRVITLMGSRGEIQGNMEEAQIIHYDFLTGNKTVYHLNSPATGHSGGDERMLRDMVAAVAADGSFETNTSAARSAHGHYMALAAEESRLLGGTPTNPAKMGRG